MQPNAEFWLVVKEWLAFEEPSTKWSHLKKLLRKELRRRKGKSIDVEKLTLEEQGCLFSHIFGGLDNGGSITPAASENLVDVWQDVISVVIALEEIGRHKPIAFEIWAQPYLQSNSTVGESQELALKGQLGVALNKSQMLWIEHSVMAAPDWSRLSQTGPWSDDPSVRVLLQFSEMIREKHGMQLSMETVFPQAFSAWLQLAKKHRSQLPGRFLPEVLLLVEGQSEEILMPAFARALGVSLDNLAVNLNPCGGAKQVAKQYLSVKEVTQLPILVVLDADVEEPTEIVRDSLRACDQLIVLTKGEIEDTFDEPTFFRILNRYLLEQGFAEQLSPIGTYHSEKRTIAVERALKARGLGTFDKIEFARVAAESMSAKEVPADARRIVEELSRITNGGIKLRFQ